MIKKFYNPYIYGSFSNGNETIIFNDTFSNGLDMLFDKLSQFKEESNFVISIDQSTKCTGITVYSEKHNYIVTLDIVPIERSTMSNMLAIFIARVCRLNGKVEAIIIESPLRHLGGWSRNPTHSEIVLDKLYKDIIDKIERNPDLTDTKVIKIGSNVWKATVINKSKGKNRVNSKYQVALDITEILPQFKQVFKECSSLGDSYDYDMFDSLGLLIHYLKNGGIYTYTTEEMFNEDFGYSITKGKSSSGNILVEYIPKDEYHEEFIESAFESVGLEYNKTQRLLLDNEVSIYENGIRALKIRDSSYSIVSSDSYFGNRMNLLYKGIISDDFDFLLIFISNRVKVLNLKYKIVNDDSKRFIRIL